MTNNVMNITNVSERDRRIIQRLIAGESESVIGITLGFSDSWLATRLIDDSVFARALFEAQRAELRNAATMAIRVIRELAETPAKTEAGKRIQLDASKALLGYGGHANAAALHAKPADRPVSEMSLEEIEKALEAAKRKASDNAQIIDQAPAIAQGSAQDDAQDVDILS